MQTKARAYKMNLAARGQVVGGESGGGGGNAVLKETLDEVSEFVQNALPVLMEIVRKGGRYSEESVASLRPSFQVRLIVCTMCYVL